MVRAIWDKGLLILLIVFTMTLLLLPQSGMAEKQHVYDFAGLLTDKQIIELENTATKFGEKKKTDFIILTIDDPEQNAKEFMSDFYDEKAFGYNKAHGDTVMIVINMSDRYVQLGGFGKMEQVLDDGRLTSIREKITPKLGDGNYLEAFTQFIKLSSRYMEFKVGVDPTNPLFNTWVQLVLAFLLAIVIVSGLARNRGMKTTVTANTYRNSQKTKLKQQRDRYIRTTVTKRRKPKQSSGGGGGFRGGGGGTTRGGRTFSGSGGKF